MLAYFRDTSVAKRLQNGLPITHLDDLSIEQARRESEFSRRSLTRLESVDIDTLPHEQWLLARMLRHTFETGAQALEDYWLTFAVTPYSGAWNLYGIQRAFASHPLASAAERDNYLRLLDAYAGLVDQIAAKTHGQAERRIRVPRPAIEGVRRTFHGLKASVGSVFIPSAQRLAQAGDSAAFRAAIDQRLERLIVPAHDRVLSIFDAAYQAQASEQVGLMHLPGGTASYLRRLKAGTGLDLTPQRIHDRGLETIAALQLSMGESRERLKFRGTADEFHAFLRSDSRFIARSPEDVEQRYLGHMRRIDPLIPRYFSKLPRAPYAVRRLDAAAEAGMTFGYYQPPSPAEPTGYYRYNGSNLAQRSLATAAHLIYHELIPGHHFHLALQAEDDSVHPVREHLYYGAFAEGWAEYAAELAQEIGMYDDPYDLYGHYLSQAFLAARLVVDTGMNHLGWSLQRARQFMREHTFESDAQIATETLRYSTDIPAQALDYRLGHDQFQWLRRRAETELGQRFDIRRFHAAAIGNGAMPLNVLAEHIDRFIARERAN